VGLDGWFAPLPSGERDDHRSDDGLQARLAAEAPELWRTQVQPVAGWTLVDRDFGLFFLDDWFH
jgi:hypothetical protein